MNVQQIYTSLKTLFGTLFSMQNQATPNGERLYAYCLTQLGKDASPKDIVPDDVGCAETVTTILSTLFPDIHVISGTYTLYQFLLGSNFFVKVGTPLPGDIIISPTGMGGKNGITNGHVGFVGKDGKIMSNQSSNGIFAENYTLDTWKARYYTKGGYPIFYFRRTL